MKNKVAIIGYGYVGKAMHKIFPDALLYDIALSPLVGNGMEYATKEQINAECGLAIVCVPTPMVEDEHSEFKRVDISIVEEVVGWLETPLILIKSQNVLE